MTDTGKQASNQDVDYTAIVAEAIPQNKELASQGNYQDAIDNLFALEKKTRMSDDGENTEKLCVAIVEICYELKEWKLLQEQVTLISKRRGQLKRALTAVVQKTMTYLDETPDEETKFEVIDTLLLVTAGKIHVENERARLTRMVVDKKEAEGDVEEACKLIQEVQVETFGSMDRKEKTQYILEQMRLTLAIKDYVRTQILSRKVSKSVFDMEDFQDEKVQYYGYMTRFYAHEKEYLEMCRCAQAIYGTPMVAEDKDKRQEALRDIVMYLVLTPHGNERQDLLHRTQQDKNMEELPLYLDLLRLFTTEELMKWPEVDATYDAEFKSRAVFQDSEEDTGESRYSDFSRRVVEHNIRVLAKYYGRISLSRMATLLNVDEATAEKNLCEEIVKGVVSGKIDRPAGVVTFSSNRNASAVLHDWSSDIGELLTLVERTCHLIHKEQMVHSVLVDGDN